MHIICSQTLTHVSFKWGWMSVSDRATALHSSVPTQVLASSGVKTM